MDVKRYDTDDEMFQQGDGEYVKYDDIKHFLERSDNSDYTASPKSCPKCHCKELEDTLKLSPHKKCCDCGHDFA